MLSVFFIALSLAVDATAAAVCCGLSNPGFRWQDAFRLGLWFGGFQAGMTLLGGVAGCELNEHFQRIGSVAAFGLLLYLGGKMLLDAMRPLEDSHACYGLDRKTIALLAVATSLDALAVGVSLAFLHIELLPAAAVIGGTAFVLSVLGSLLGQQASQRFHRWASAAGGLVLAVIGMKILLEALVR